MWLRRRKWLVLLVGVVVAGVGVAYALDDADAVSHAPPTMNCRQQVELATVRRPGWPWQQHLNRLVVPDIEFNRSTQYYIVDEKTKSTYYWPFLGTTNGLVSFAVQTRWTVLHPDWRARTWVLHYDCQS